jgi:hypothetical protein
MVPYCEKCLTPMVHRKDQWIRQCRCKFEKTPKAPQNRMTRNQKKAFRKSQRMGREGKYSFFKMAWVQRPAWAKIS